MALIRDKTENGLESEENVMHAIASTSTTDVIFEDTGQLGLAFFFVTSWFSGLASNMVLNWMVLEWQNGYTTTVCTADIVEKPQSPPVMK